MAQVIWSWDEFPLLKYNVYLQTQYSNATLQVATCFGAKEKTIDIIVSLDCCVQAVTNDAFLTITYVRNYKYISDKQFLH
jgi:hypothetical protein